MAGIWNLSATVVFLPLCVYWKRLGQHVVVFISKTVVKSLYNLASTIMGFKCCVPNCRGNYDNGPKVSVFSFPKEKKLRQIWINAIHRMDFQPSQCSKVCIYVYVSFYCIYTISYQVFLFVFIKYVFLCIKLQHCRLHNF